MVNKERIQGRGKHLDGEDALIVCHWNYTELAGWPYSHAIYSCLHPAIRKGCFLQRFSFLLAAKMK